MAKANSTHSEEPIIQRLDALIAVLMLGKNESVGEKATMLRNFGLDYKTIARILRKTEKHISKELSIFKKRKGGTDGR